MAEKNLPWGLKNDKITPGSVKVTSLCHIPHL